MSLLDSLGESLSGFSDSVLTTAGNYISGMADNQVKKSQSAAPEENRVTKEAIAQEPTGQIAPNQQTAPDNTPKYLLYAVCGMAGIALLIALRR